MFGTRSLSSKFTTYNPNTEHINDKPLSSRTHFFIKLVETISLRPVVKLGLLSYRVIKLLTWVLAKSSLDYICGCNTKAAEYLENEYLKTAKVVRDLLFTPSLAVRAFKDMIQTNEKSFKDIEKGVITNYLNVGYTKVIQQFSSYLHGCKTFQLILPEGITEFTAASNALKTVRASHLFKPNTLVINFSIPNVATFVTEKQQDGSTHVLKVGAHSTHDKIPSGVFLVPINLPEEALSTFKQAATELSGSQNITCVNTNCRVLEKAGFSIEGVAMKDIVLPQTLFEHLLFRNVFYRDSTGIKQKVLFDIVNTTNCNLEELFEDIDTAVVGTSFRHNADIIENQKKRNEVTKALIAEETKRLAEAGSNSPEKYTNEEKRKIRVSNASYIGKIISKKHTIYELDLTDRLKEISEPFENMFNKEACKLHPFPQTQPTFTTHLKRNVSGLVIRFLRPHMMGRVDEIDLHIQDIFSYFKSTNGTRLNYVLLNDKLVLSKIHTKGEDSKGRKKEFLREHDLIAGRQDVYCSGEMWYDKARDRFVMNGDSDTYTPCIERVLLTVKLANGFFQADQFDNVFEAEQNKQHIQTE